MMQRPGSIDPLRKQACHTGWILAEGILNFRQYAQDDHEAQQAAQYAFLNQ